MYTAMHHGMVVGMALRNVAFVLQCDRDVHGEKGGLCEGVEGK